METTAASSYMACRLNTEAWDNATEANKSKALDTADRQLKPYYYRVSSEIYWNAVYEQALWLLQADGRAILQQAGVTSATIGGASETFNLKGRPAWICPQAWQFVTGASVKVGGLR